jgi:hypothetical protein
VGQEHKIAFTSGLTRATMKDAMSATDDRSVVQARRPSWTERHPDVTSKLVAVFVPIVLLGSSLGFGWYAHLGFSDHPVGGGVFGVIGMAALALFVFGDLNSVRGWWFSACPLCGHEEARDYRGGQSAECGACPAYLRAEDGKVAEEKPDAVEFRPIYTVRPLDLGGRQIDEVRFPEVCVLCGEPATERRPIHALRLGPDDPRPQASPSGPRRSITLDEQAWGPTAPFCLQHLADPQDPIEIFQGELQFRSYAQYRAFCRLNGIERRGKG